MGIRVLRNYAMVVCGVGRADLSTDEAISEQDFELVNLGEYVFRSESRKPESLRYIQSVATKLSEQADLNSRGESITVPEIMISPFTSIPI